MAFRSPTLDPIKTQVIGGTNNPFHESNGLAGPSQADSLLLRPLVTGRMYVLKRDGRREPVLFDKITKRIEILCDIEPKLAPDIVDPVVVAQKVVSGVFPGVKTTELDNLAAETAAYMSTIHPAYGDLAARIAISNLQKQTSPNFAHVIKMEYDYVNPKNDQPAPLIAEDVYQIIMKNAERLNDAIRYERDFNYDYFGFKTLERSYLLKLSGEIVERPQHMLMRVSVGIHKEDIVSAIETYNLLSQKYFTHATPTLFNAGTPIPQLSSCFLVDMKEDSIEGIYETLKRCALISKSAGGIGLSISCIRASQSYIRGTNGTSNGLVPMLRVYNDTARYVDQGNFHLRLIEPFFRRRQTKGCLCNLLGTLACRYIRLFGTEEEHWKRREQSQGFVLCPLGSRSVYETSRKE